MDVIQQSIKLLAQRKLGKCLNTAYFRENCACDIVCVNTSPDQSVFGSSCRELIAQSQHSERVTYQDVNMSNIIINIPGSVSSVCLGCHKMQRRSLLVKF